MSIKESFAALLDQDEQNQTDPPFGPVSQEEIAKVEDALSVRLPISFKQYLEVYAGGMVFGMDIYGIPTIHSQFPSEPHISSITDIVQETLQMREFYPASHVYICSDGGGYFFFLDTSQMSNEEECPVVMYGPGALGTRVANNFLHFIEQLSNNASFTGDYNF